jgi:hypothetical protein
MPAKTVTVTLSGGAITVDKWVVPVDLSATDVPKDWIKWIGVRCSIKILPDHPEHFSQILPPASASVVIGTFADSAPAGTYKYRIVVTGGNNAIDPELRKKIEMVDLDYPFNETMAEVYIIDPDYKVDR